MSDAGPSHAQLMDATYRYQRLFYDATRKYYLLGRDRLISALNPDSDARILEVACGTGRNLAAINKRYPGRTLYGLDISEQMLSTARAKLPADVQLAQADACNFDPETLFGVKTFDRIVLSYSLSMIPDWKGALSEALKHLAPGGELHLVDFGDQARLPNWFKGLLRRWLARFHVTPRDELEIFLKNHAALTSLDLNHQFLFRNYARYAKIG